MAKSKNPSNKPLCFHEREYDKLFSNFSNTNFCDKNMGLLEVSTMENLLC